MIDDVDGVLRSLENFAESFTYPRSASTSPNLASKRPSTPPRARRNVPMTELARSYRIGQHVMWRFGVAELRARGAADQLEAYTDATFAAGDVLMGDALERYAQERDRWVRSADAVRRATVQELLAGETADVAAAGARLRYELRRPHVAFVVWAEDEDAGLEATAVALGGPGALVVPLGAGTMAGWCPPATLDRAPVAEARIAFGLPGDGAEGFRRSHLQAMEARRVARLGGLREPVDYDDVALAALLTADLEQARDFAAHELADLAEPGNERLADTALEVLVHQGSPRRAGQALGLHENTIAKRVRAAEAALGRPIDRRPAQTLAALLILRVSRGSGAAATGPRPVPQRAGRGGAGDEQDQAQPDAAPTGRAGWECGPTTRLGGHGRSGGRSLAG